MEDAHTKGSTYKTRVTIEDVREFLVNRCGDDITDLAFIKGGETSQAFSYSFGPEGYIIRINKHSSWSFEKDRLCFERFSSPTLPIPQVIDIGSFNDKAFFAISEKAEGMMVSDLPKESLVRIAPESLAILDRIHEADIRDTAGYGYWERDRKGEYRTWKEFVLAIETEKVRGWPKLFEETFMEKDLYEKLCGELKRLVDFCPEDRSLLHGDFGFENLISDGKRITGVIDWAESRYGDFLFDAAWVSFWPSEYDYSGLLRKHYEGRVIEYYSERIMCYQVYIALNSLGFYARSNQKEKYDWAKKRVLDIVR